MSAVAIILAVFAVSLMVGIGIGKVISLGKSDDDDV